jgi:hypothetical protein
MFPPDGARFSRQFQILRIFDALIHNSDRNPGNLLWTSDWGRPRLCLFQASSPAPGR